VPLAVVGVALAPQSRQRANDYPGHDFDRVDVLGTLNITGNSPLIW
jgi:hypothetical protein